MTYQKIKKSFARKYADLSSFEQHLLQLCSVMYETKNRTTVLKCYKKAGLPLPKGPFTQAKHITPFMKRLQECDFLDKKLNCRPEIAESATRCAIHDGHYDAMVEVVLQEVPIRKKSYGYYGPEERDCPLLMRDFRIGIYTHHMEMISTNYETIMESRSCSTLIPEDPFLQVCNSPFDGKWFMGLSSKIRIQALKVILSHQMENQEPDQEALNCALQHDLLTSIPKAEKNGFYSLLATRLILGGRLEEAFDLIGMFDNSGYTLGFNGWVLFLKGQNKEAINSFEADLKTYRKMVHSRSEYFGGMAGIFFVLALLKTRDASLLPKITKIIKKAKSYSYVFSFMLPIYDALDRVCEIQKGNVDLVKVGSNAGLTGDGGIAEFFRVFASYWLNNKISSEEAKALKTVSSIAKWAGWKWLSMESNLLLSKASQKSRPDHENFVKKLQDETGMISILSMVPHEELWQKSLRALMGTGKLDSGPKGDVGNTRLVWLFRFGHGDISLQPLEQKLSKTGKWSKGRNVALKRLLHGTNLDYITHQDRRISQTIREESSYYSGTTYYFDGQKAILELIGHPLVFTWDSSFTPVTIERGEPVVTVKKMKSQLKIVFSPEISDEKIIMVEQSATRIEVIQVNAEHRRIAGILGKSGLKVPLSGKEDAMAAIGAISDAVSVHSSIGGAAEKVSETDADPVPRMRILPSGNGFRLELLAKPFGEGGPYVKPGIGNETLIAGVNGKRMQVRRDLKTEAALAAVVETACPSLVMGLETEHEWQLDKPLDCLQVLSELKTLQNNNQVVMEWPEGEKLKVTQEISFDHFKMGIRTGTDWFEVNGTLAVDEDLALDMSKLLDLVRESENRFIPLGDNHFVALTAEFRKRLMDMDTYAYRKGKTVRFHPLSALLLGEFAENLSQVKTDRKWQTQVNRFKKIMDMVPPIPSTLKAELRDYQVAGFQWMTRLAHWGVGACLADDMGLGKTVQALAVLLDRASDGPALIVAPTSVCHNWMVEAHRFAPTLNPILFGGKDRDGLVQGVKAFDVLVCSYGLMQQESDLLGSRKWHTIVLDEAQAIKNVMAKRSQAAMNLKGDFRIITTGTPIENHLGELWTLFHFINPGLLGSLKQFNVRFAVPVERNNDRRVNKRLKKLIQPFILRRNKTAVLEELPAKTEVMLHVEMDKKEAAFYEALRRNALQNLEQDNSPTGQKHLKILSEIMRLRRACCHPRLILPESPLSGAKLTLFGEVVSELLENRHKALVFSQFVGHLNLLREYLDGRKIDYRYLDGSTPARVRQTQVERFQKGEGDLFLISLKAGGLGLNLTAASYVIHMDPWWNPAVEDQASDRAHRIGQQHPVTVYRLVTRGTIEEKIIALHRKKRDLADSLLDGSDMAGRVSAEELLRLIRED